MKYLIIHTKNYIKKTRQSKKKQSNNKLAI